MKVSAKNIFHWDVPVWSQAISFWERHLPAGSGNVKTLELASNKGGLSLYMASKGFDVICSDVSDPRGRAEKLHAVYGGHLKIRYQAVNALSIPFENDMFDVVMFKSFLGYLPKEQQAEVISEIRRVLKPGGVLLFAENLKGSWLHRWMRRNFVSWGTKWNYITVQEMKEMVEEYSFYEAKTEGFLSLFFPNAFLKSAVYPIDKLVGLVLPSELKYVLFGAARK